MATTRIHDLAAEFGISSEQLLGMLKERDIFVRSHLSPLKPEQVALMRAAWERDKRKQKEAPALPKRRRAVKAVEPVPATSEARPKRRRRTAAEMAAVEAEAQAEAAIEAEREDKAREALEAAKAVDAEEKPSLEERAAALFRDLPAPEGPGMGVETPLTAVSATAYSSSRAAWKPKADEMSSIMSKSSRWLIVTICPSSLKAKATISLAGTLRMLASSETVMNSVTRTSVFSRSFSSRRFSSSCSRMLGPSSRRWTPLRATGPLIDASVREMFCATAS